MSSGFSALLAAAVVLTVASPLAAAETAGPAKTCFRLSQVQSMRPDGDKTVYARVNNRDVYKLQMKHQCSTLKDKEGLVLSPAAGGDVVCGALDLDIGARSLGGYVEPCFLDTISKLTPEEIAALPPKVR